MNLGIDFGSTYSSFATYNGVAGAVELCRSTHSESEAVPSIVCLDEDGILLTGHEAREQAREDADTVRFETFKMLLAESNQKILQDRGYYDRYTPRYIAERFLDQQVKKILTNRCESSVENLVVCVPEVWTTKESANQGMLDGRFILKEICQGISGVEQVQVVSEPAAASAFFSNYYQKLTGEQLSGYVLVIDYGGGTLDLTLTKVNSSEKGDNAVEIEVKNRTGVGENHLGKIGDAGVAYMEEVVRMAVVESPETDVDDPASLDPKEPSFWRAYNNLERKLKGQTVSGSRSAGGVEENFRLYNAVQDCIDDISQLADNHDCFAAIKYGKTKINVTFSQLLHAYDKLIRDKLNDCLSTMAEYMDEAGIDYENSSNDQFHVVLVGGFGKFIFVQNQIQEFFDASSTGDKRFEFDLGENREFAVAMGAALLAEEIIVIKHTAPYAIGVVSFLQDETPVPNYAIKYRQEISADIDYWLCNENAPKRFINASAEVTTFLIGYDIKGERSHKLVIKPELVKYITAAYNKLSREYAAKFPHASPLGLAHNLGFNMDDSEIVTLLIRSIATGSVERIVLKSYQDMFELTEI